MKSKLKMNSQTGRKESTFVPVVVFVVVVVVHGDVEIDPDES